jgi:hypothetical protein
VIGHAGALAPPRPQCTRVCDSVAAATRIDSKPREDGIKELGVDDARLSRLTERQKACLRLVRAGYTT